VRTVGGGDLPVPEFAPEGCRLWKRKLLWSGKRPEAGRGGKKSSAGKKRNTPLYANTRRKITGERHSGGTQPPHPICLNSNGRKPKCQPPVGSYLKGGQGETITRQPLARPDRNHQALRGVQDKKKGSPLPRFSGGRRLSCGRGGGTFLTLARAHAPPQTFPNASISPSWEAHWPQQSRGNVENQGPPPGIRTHWWTKTKTAWHWAGTPTEDRLQRKKAVGNLRSKTRANPKTYWGEDGGGGKPPDNPVSGLTGPRIFQGGKRRFHTTQPERRPRMGEEKTHGKF